MGEKISLIKHQNFTAYIHSVKSRRGPAGIPHCTILFCYLYNILHKRKLSKTPVKLDSAMSKVKLNNLVHKKQPNMISSMLVVQLGKVGSLSLNNSICSSEMRLRNMWPTIRKKKYSK